MSCCSLVRHMEKRELALCTRTVSYTHLVGVGKIRYYGLSNFTPEDTLAAHELLPVSAVQLQYSMAVSYTHLAEKFQSNSEIAGSPRNSFRASLMLEFRR